MAKKWELFQNIIAISKFWAILTSLFSRLFFSFELMVFDCVCTFRIALLESYDSVFIWKHTANLCNYQKVCTTYLNDSHVIPNDIPSTLFGFRFSQNSDEMMIHHHQDPAWWQKDLFSEELGNIENRFHHWQMNKIIYLNVWNFPWYV